MCQLIPPSHGQLLTTGVKGVKIVLCVPDTSGWLLVGKVAEALLPLDNILQSITAHVLGDVGITLGQISPQIGCHQQSAILGVDFYNTLARMDIETNMK